MAQQPPTELDTLHVQVASRLDRNLPASTRSIQLITSEEIASLPVQTVSELLDWAIGVDVLSRSPAQSDLSIRGTNFEQVVVMVNGVRMSDPQTGHFDLNLVVPLDAVERVEVLRGAASALYGADAMGGVVNVVTKRGRDPVSGGVRAGSWNTLRVSAGGGIDRGGSEGVSVNASGETSRSDGHRQGTDYDATLMHLSVAKTTASGSLVGEFGASRRDFGAQDFYAPYPSFERTRLYTGSVGWKSDDQHSGPFALETRLSARRHDDDFVLVRDDPSLYRNQHTSSQGGGTVLGRYTNQRGFDIAVGGELFWETLRSSNLGDRTERRGAVFAEALLGGVGPVAVSAGARTDWHQGFGVFMSPSLSGSVNAASGLRVRGSLGRSFRAPTWTERYYQDPVNVGRPDLRPEHAWSAELGADLFRWDAMRLSTTVFLRHASSLIDWARDIAADDTIPWETRNVEDATYRGIEGELELSGPYDLKWTAGGTALSVRSEEAEGFLSKYALRPLREQLNLGLERQLGSNLSARLRVKHGRREGEASYRRMDARVSLRVATGWLHIDALNITDFDYPDVTGARAPGRAVFVGYSLGR